MIQREYHGVRLECVQGNIVEQPDVDTIVNAANASLAPGGGVAGAIHRAAGPGVAEAGRHLAPIHPGEAVITGAYRLPNKHVIHCLGPVYGVDNPSDVLLASCYRNALKLAEERGIPSIAFPAISTGIFGYPVKEAAHVAFATILAEVPHLSSMKLIRFVLFSKADLDVHEQVLRDLSARND